MFEKKDFDASRECNFGDVLSGDEDISGRTPILGESDLSAGRICMFMFGDRPWRAGDKGGEPGDCGESVDRALRVPMFGDWAMSLLELIFRFSGGTLGALGILTKRAYPASALQVPVEPCFTTRCRFLRWWIVSRSVGLQPANCLLYHHTATGKPLELQPCRVRRSNCFRVLVGCLLLYFCSSSSAGLVGRTDVIKGC